MKHFILLNLVIFILSLSGFAQVTNINFLINDKSNYRFQKADENVNYSISLLDSTKLKIASRKKVYRLGETMILDVALLNSSSEANFYPLMRALDIKVKNRTGNIVGYYPRIWQRENWSPGFNLITPNYYNQESYEIRIKCDKEIIKRDKLLGKVKNSTEILEKNLFISPGDSCVDINKPIELNFSLILENKYVAILSDYPKTKTATGKIISNSLKIKIIK